MTKLPWISVKDRLPEQEKEVIFWSAFEECAHKGYVWGTTWYSVEIGRGWQPLMPLDVTHWIEVTPPEEN